MPVGQVVEGRDLLRTYGYYLQVASLAALAPAPLLTAYCASKSGVEAFTHALRAEVAHRGVGAGIVYLSWADTALIRAADQTAVSQELRTHLPWPASVTHDTAPFVRAMVRGIERRSARVGAPPWLRRVQAARAACRRSSRTTPGGSSPLAGTAPCRPPAWSPAPCSRTRGRPKPCRWYAILGACPGADAPQPSPQAPARPFRDCRGA